jgi:hypothetical protein
VTVGKQLAIPVGTYVEGVLDKVTKGGRSGPSLKMHFTRLDYVNGYSVDIDDAGEPCLSGLCECCRICLPRSVVPRG